MDRLDYDLCSVQEARVLLENGREAQRELITFSQEKLNAIVEAMVEAAYLHAKELAIMSAEETGLGKSEDKYVKNIFASRYLWSQMMYRKRLSTSVFRLAL